MADGDDEDEIPLGLKVMDRCSAYPETLLNDLFKRGFTAPPALRMNSIYGKYASEHADQKLGKVLRLLTPIIAARAALRLT